MRKVNSSHFTPLMRFSIPLTLGIVTGHFCYGLFSVVYPLVATLLAWAISLYVKKTRLQVAIIYLCIFCLGNVLTMHQMEQEKIPTQMITSDHLSSFDRTLLVAQDCRMKAQQRLQDLHIEGQDYAVVSAMALGDKTALSKETKDIYSISGSSHILAVSGLHIGIIFQLFVLLMGGRRRSLLTIAVSMIAIWAYVVFIGMPASAVRSATMISICGYAMLANKKALSINNLCFAYVIMLLYRPLYLFEVSFQMSFMAVLSILLFLPALMEMVHCQHRWSRWLWGIIGMSLAAQIGTVPLVVYYFGRVSVYALLTSLIAIPAATLILYLSAALMLLIPFTWMAWTNYLATPLLHLIASCLRSITQACTTAMHLTTLLPGANVEGIKTNIPQLCLIYFGIIVGYILLKKVSHSKEKP